MTIRVGDTRAPRNSENETREAAQAPSRDTKTNRLNPIIEDVVRKRDDGLNWTNIGA